MGIPILAPEIVLLYKAANPRAKDDAALRQLRAHLDDTQRAWLGRALMQSYAADHPWVEELTV